MSTSTTILSNTTHPGDSTQESVAGEKFKGDGYYGRSDGLHTIQYTFSGLTGTITIQASLEDDPSSADWFDVHSYTADNETASKIANFIGNYVWIRANINYTDGTVDSIVLNN